MKYDDDFMLGTTKEMVHRFCYNNVQVELVIFYFVEKKNIKLGIIGMLRNC